MIEDFVDNNKQVL